MDRMECESPAADAPTGPVIRALLAAASVLRDWERRYWSRRMLEEMGDDALRDLGISRGDALHEAAKTLWRP